MKLTTINLLAISAMAAASNITPANIIAIAPTTSSCSSASIASECRTADQAVKWINFANSNFGLTTFASQAAVLSLMLYESGNFQYSRNHFPAPGRPGQGTRNMQMPPANLKFARWLANVCLNCRISSDSVEKANTQGPDAVLALVNTDEFGFASAAWYLKTQCTADVQAELAKGTQAGWERYMACVGVSATEDRTAVWKKAMALGKW